MRPMPAVASILVLVLVLNVFEGTNVLSATAQTTPPLDIETGWEIPSEGYCDQPYVVKLKDGKWLCVMTTGKGHEGTRDQHIVATYSNDKGRTWSPLVDIEPAEGPEASWAMPFLTPGGRVYVFYTYNAQDMLEVIADTNKSKQE